MSQGKETAVQMSQGVWAGNRMKAENSYRIAATICRNTSAVWAWECCFLPLPHKQKGLGECPSVGFGFLWPLRTLADCLKLWTTSGAKRDGFLFFSLYIYFFHTIFLSSSQASFPLSRKYCPSLKWKGRLLLELNAAALFRIMRNIHFRSIGKKRAKGSTEQTAIISWYWFRATGKIYSN